MISTLDPIKLLDDLIARARFGAGVRFLWPRSGAWYGARVEMLLRQYGIRVYARQYAHAEQPCLGVTVRKAQAEWAAYVLGRAGVPLVSPAWAVHRVQPGPMPRAWGRPARATGWYGVVVQALFGGPAKRRRG